MVLELLVQRYRSLFPKHPHHVNESAVARRFRDALMEQPIGAERLLDPGQLPLHQLERILERRDLRLTGRLCRQRRALALDHAACAEEFERPRCRLDFVGGVVLLAAPDYVDTRADAHVDQPLDLERDQGLAHRRPRHPELPREVTLGRQPRAGGELAGTDQGANLIRDLAIKPPRFYALDGHRLPLAGARAYVSRIANQISRNWSSGITNSSGRWYTKHRDAVGLGEGA